MCSASKESTVGAQILKDLVIEDLPLADMRGELVERNEGGRCTEDRGRGAGTRKDTA